MTKQEKKTLEAIERQCKAANCGCVPEGWKLVPVEPTPEIIAGAAVAVWPVATSDDVKMALGAARIVLTRMDASSGASIEMIAASIATMAPAYRAMLAAAPAAPAPKMTPHTADVEQMLDRDDPATAAQADEIRQLLWDAAKAIQWHLDPNSPDEHEALMKRLYEAARQQSAAPTEGARDAGVGTAVAKVAGCDGYGPLLEWYSHWTSFRDAKLYARPDPLLAEAVEALELVLRAIELNLGKIAAQPGTPMHKARAVLAKVQAAKEKA